MSSGARQDWHATREQLRNPSPIRDGSTWLRHKEGSMSALIDVMLLEGKYSAKEIAMEINRRFKNKPIKVRIRKVRDHISHLKDGSDDSWRQAHRMQPHRLKLKEVNETWSFQNDR